MTHTHTPGPWHITDEGSQIVVQTFSDHPTGTLARIYRVDELAYSDARLISAAPELLEALQMLLPQEPREADSYDRAMWENARAAIAKAIGKEDA
jgi:hypothetical protein